MATTKLEFGVPVQVVSGMAGGKWKVPGPGTPGYSFGDGQIIRDETYGVYRFAMRIGGTTGGCGYVEKPLDGRPHDWSSTTMPGGPADPIKAIPTGLNNTNAVNVDTASMVVNPVTGVVTATFGVSPGSISELYSGVLHSIQRRTSKSPHFGPDLQAPEGWNHFGNEHVARFEGTFDPEWTGVAWHAPRIVSVGPPLTLAGGCLENSIFHDAANNRMVVGYQAQSAGTTQWMTAAKSRTGLKTAPMTDFDTTPTWSYEPALTDSSWSWDPEDDPAYVTQASEMPTTWGTMVGLPHQGNITVAADGTWWMTGINQKPSTSLFNMGQSTAIGLWYSVDDGEAWVQMEDNPVVTKELFGLSELVSQNWLNSPFLLHEPGVVWLFFWANHQGQDVTNHESTELYAMSAPLAQGARFSPRLLVDEDEFDSIFGKSQLWEETHHGMRRR